ncbi:hypothetical protein FIV42_14970 [Persicimonas caeni]|uniref:ORC1/DEAH AAA+ ATPase domain-containing protein n=1 Tax=Persicimonas caeni TaxID=2292766 RepID=A0A4Y6PUS6_PERCE|nr:AAA family ATPase [Persicimonas caeni]QDG51993.1 hypothetical protein FIV42_14970 [Persicimonas caeni]QED33214.1 hypothetical protein FRD00_14965 [Persicimonas caeni]
MANLTPKAFVALHLAGASQLWADVPEAMPAAVERLDRLVARTLDEDSGELVATHRADTIAVFDSPDEAIAWACRLQRELLQCDWSPRLLEHPLAAESRDDDDRLVFRGLRLGLGVELGTPVRRLHWRDGQVQLVGEVVDRACDYAQRAAAGGIVAGAEAVHALEEGAALDLEIDELAADVGPPLYAITARELSWRRQQSALQATSRRTNLPSYRTRFFGRAAELAVIARLADEGASWVSLIGTAGIGKTRLAVEFARRSLQDRTDGGREAWFCDLSEAAGVADALYVIARVMEVQLPLSDEIEVLADRLESSVAGRGDVLLLIDNAEDLIDELAPVLEGWLEESEGLLLVVTSRRRAGHRLETAVELDSLGRDAARILLEDRLATPRGVQVRFGAQDRPALQEIVERCGELPLAIELVAASGRRLTPRQLLRAWQEDEADTPMSRLQQAIARTFEMIQPFEQHALLQCSIFAGGFTVESAADVVDLSSFDDAPAVSDVLETLHNHSLLRSRAGRDSAEETRLSMYEPVRGFATALLDAEAAEEARGRHAAHFVRWSKKAVAGLEGAAETDWIGRLTEELPNLIAAYEHSLECDPDSAVRLVIVLGELDKRVGPLGGQKERADQAVVLAEEVADDALLAEALVVRGQTCMWIHKYDGAADDFARAQELVRESGDASVLTRALLGRTFAVGHRGHYREGLEYAKQAYDVARGSGTLDEIAALAWCGVMLGSLERDDEGVRRFSEALVLARQLGNPSMLARVLSSLGTAIGGDQPAEGRRYLNEALEIFRTQGNRRRATVALFELARVAGWEGDHRREERYYDEALVEGASIGVSQYEALLLHGRARSRFMRGQYTRAEDDLISALAKVQNQAYLDLSVWIWSYLGACYAALDRLAEAEKFFARAEEAIEDTDAAKLAVVLEVLRGFQVAANARKLYGADDFEAAEAELERAYACCEYPGQEGVPHVNEAHAIARALREALDMQVEQGLVPPHVAPTRRVLQLGPDARWFAIDRGEHVDISRRGALRKILAALVDRRFDAPGEPMSVDDVMAAGWPDEVLTPSSGARRVYSTINRMRDLGLDEVLQTVDDGYMIDPAVTPVRSKHHD